MRTERYDTERSGEERLPATGFPDATGESSRVRTGTP